MDLATSQKPKNPTTRLISLLIAWLPAVLIIIFLLSKTGFPMINNQNGFDSLASKNLLPYFKYYRNLAYLFYAALMILFGMIILIRTVFIGNKSTAKMLQETVNSSLSGILLVTFSYSIVGLILDIYSIIVKILNPSKFP